MILIFNGRSCLPCTALPYSRTAAYPQFNTPPIHEIGRGPRRGTPFYVRTISSVWGHFGCFTRSAFRRTPSLNKTHFLVTGSSVGVLSEFSRSSVGRIGEGIREGKETAILTKSTFPDLEFLGSSLVRLWFVLGLLPEGDREGTKERIINKKHFLGECDV